MRTCILTVATLLLAPLAALHAASAIRGVDDVLLEPMCMASMLRRGWQQSDRPGRILFANPDNTEKTMTNWALDRKRLSVKMSLDDGKTWTASRVLEEGPSGYSDLAALPNGTILCLYECGMVTRMGDDKYLTLARFNHEWLAAGKGLSK